MARIGRTGSAIARALTQHDDQTDEQPGNGGGNHHDTDKTDGPEDDVTHGDLARDRRLVDRLDDDWMVGRRRGQGRRGRGLLECHVHGPAEASPYGFRLPHASTASASSASVRTPTPVAPFG